MLSESWEDEEALWQSVWGRERELHPSHTRTVKWRFLLPYPLRTSTHQRNILRVTVTHFGWQSSRSVGYIQCSLSYSGHGAFLLSCSVHCMPWHAMHDLSGQPMASLLVPNWNCCCRCCSSGRLEAGGQTPGELSGPSRPSRRSPKPGVARAARPSETKRIRHVKSRTNTRKLSCDKGLFIVTWFCIYSCLESH